MSFLVGLVAGRSMPELVVALAVAAVVVWIAHRWSGYMRNRRAMASVSPDVVIVSQAVSYISLVAMLPREWPLVKWLMPYCWVDLHEPLDRVFRRTRAKAVAFVAPDHAELFINDEKLVKDVMIKMHDRFIKPAEDYDSLRGWGENIVTAPTEGYEWKKHRAVCTPAFSSGNLVLVAKTTVENANKLFDQWEHQTVTGQDEEAYYEARVDEGMTKLMLSVIAKAGFGRDINPAQPEACDSAKYTMSFSEAMKIVSDNMLLCAAMPWIFKIPFGRPRVIRNGFKDFESYLKVMIAEKREAQQKKDKSIDQAKEIDLLSLLCSTQEANSTTPLDNNEIFSDAFIFLLAGHETTAHTMMWALALLALNPHEQQQLYDDVVSVIGNREPTYDDFDNLAYAQCVFRETLRLYPPVVGVPKRATEDVTLHGNYRIPSGTRVTMATYTIHRNEQYWEDPDVFRPSRFDTREAKKQGGDFKSPVTSGHFLPFSLGRRSCIGNRFAQVEGVTVLAKIAQRYTIHLPPGTDPAKLLMGLNTITLGPLHPMKLWFKRRN